MKIEKQDLHDRKRQDIEDDKDKLLYSELTGVIYTNPNYPAACDHANPVLS